MHYRVGEVRAGIEPEIWLSRMRCWDLIQELQGVPVTAPSLEHIFSCDYRDLKGQLDRHLVSEI